MRPEEGPAEALDGHSRSRPVGSLILTPPRSAGFGIYCSYFLTGTFWVRMIISWTGRRAPRGWGYEG